MASKDKKESQKKTTSVKKAAPKKKAGKPKSVKKKASQKTPIKSKSIAIKTPEPTKTNTSKKSPDSLDALINIPDRPGNNKIQEKPDVEAEGWLEEKLIQMSSSAKALTKTTAVTKVDDDEEDPEALERGDVPKSIVEHLSEFRSRLMKVLGLFILLTCVGFYFSEYVVDFINAPFLETGQKLNMFRLMGGFVIRLKASALIALLLMIPVIIFHVWRFAFPAMNKRNRRFSRLVVFSAVLLFYSGAAFVFFLLIPMMIPILTQFIPPSMLITIGADDYLSFVIVITIAMGVLFELPIIVLILTRMGIITPQFLISKRRHAIVVIFIVSAILTPQDVITIFFVAIPLCFLYELSIYLSKFMLIRLSKSEKASKNKT